MEYKKFFNSGWIGNLVALIAGALLTLAFAPFNLFPLAIIAPTLLLATWLNVSAKQAFWRGWLFGVGTFGTGIYWVFISIHVFGQSPVWLAGFITAGFIALLSVFYGLNGYLLNRYFPYNNITKLVCAFPAIWVILEWSRSWLFSGFPWLSIGYTQIYSPLKGYAPIFSVYGISLLLVLMSGLIITAILKAQRKQRKLCYYLIGTIVGIWLIGGALSFIPWTKPDGNPIKMSLIQGNIPQEIKWNEAALKPTLERYQQLSEKLWKTSQIIVWPEAAIPAPPDYVSDFLEKMDKLAKKHNAALITGIPIRTPNSNSFYNSVVVLGNGTGIYNKHRLVPFGEFVPLSAYLKKWLDILHIPTPESTPGVEKPEPLKIGDAKIATFICYEIAFPEQVLMRDGTTNLILTVSNDGWFGHSIAQAQHIQMAQMRAVEMGRPVIFVANDGITAFITPQGKIQSAAPQYQPYALTDSIQPTVGKTPWQWLALDPLLVILGVMLFIAIRWHRR